jgi:hypothetical protein
MKNYYIYETFAILHDALDGPVALFLSVQDNRTQATGDIPATSKLQANSNTSCYVKTVRDTPLSSVMGILCVFFAQK